MQDPIGRERQRRPPAPNPQQSSPQPASDAWNRPPVNPQQGPPQTPGPWQPGPFTRQPRPFGSQLDSMFNMQGPRAGEMVEPWVRHLTVENPQFGGVPPPSPNLPLAPSEISNVIETNLRSADSFFIQQKIELLELITGFETQNQYVVFNNRGEIFLTASEQSDWMARNCCGNVRSFEMTFRDKEDKLAMFLDRPFQGAFDCCNQQLDIFYPPGVFFGQALQEMSFCAPSITLVDSQQSPVLMIEGPVCAQGICCEDVNFKVFSQSTLVGEITRIWTEQEFFTDANVFGARFDPGIPLEYKVLLLGAIFLMDFLVYEH